MGHQFKDKPLSGDLLSQSQVDLQTNFEYLQGALGGAAGTGKDHQIVFLGQDTNAGEGRHNSVGFIDRGVQGFPTDGLTAFMYATAGNIFWRNSTQGPFQLTNGTAGVVAANGPAIGTNGSTFLGGGIILKWGNFLATSFGTSTGTVSFNVPFPTACFNVVITQGDNTDTATNFQIVAVAAGQFTYRQAKSPSNYYYIAIGN